MPITKKIGILGGGQLGKMLAIEGAKWHLHLEALENDPQAPAAHVVTQLHLGSYSNYDDVLNFGRAMDVIGIEIEHVNTDALRKLKQDGKQVIPDPDILDIIKDKGLQKQFYRTHGLPTSSFKWYDGKEHILKAIEAQELQLPFVQKSRQAGYDGKGVLVVKNHVDLDKLMDVPSVVEDAVNIDKELAIIAARNQSGQIALFPIVEMLFNPDANLVENLVCPAAITNQQSVAIEKIAMDVMHAFQIEGLLAIELFLDKNGTILINEVAPRPHNSGHHTIEACTTCQYQQQLRAYLNLPLGDTTLKQPAMMLNLLGSPGYTGKTHYEGLSEVLNLPDVFVHIYGKTTTKPFRKMGHVTILGNNRTELDEKAAIIRTTLKVIAQ